MWWRRRRSRRWRHRKRENAYELRTRRYWHVNKCGFCFHRAKSDCFPHDTRIRVFLIRHNACKRSQLVTIKSNFSAKNKFQLIKIGAAAAVEIVAALLYSFVGLLSRFLFILCRLFILWFFVRQANSSKQAQRYSVRGIFHLRRADCRPSVSSIRVYFKLNLIHIFWFHRARGRASASVSQRSLAFASQRDYNGEKCVTRATASHRACGAIQNHFQLKFIIIINMYVGRDFRILRGRTSI